MKISNYEITVVGCSWRNLTFLELETDDGLVGVGEARMPNRTETLVACLHEVIRLHVIGEDPRDAPRMLWSIGIGDYSRVGEIVATAMSAIDIACLDLVARAADVPAWSLLGGRFHEGVAVYGNGWFPDGQDPSEFAERATAAVALGYRALKFDPFGRVYRPTAMTSIARAVTVVRAVREAVGNDVELFVEMHGRFDGATAVRAARELEPFAVGWVEEPVPPDDLESYARVRAATSIPIAGGERVHTLGEFAPLLDRRLVDVLQPDLTHVGGFATMRKLAGWAEACGVALAPHNVAGPVATAANMHVAVGAPAFRILEHFNDFDDPFLSELVAGAPTLDRPSGRLQLSDAPGLGVTLDRALAREYPIRDVRTRLFEPPWSGA